MDNNYATLIHNHIKQPSEFSRILGPTLTFLGCTKDQNIVKQALPTVNSSFGVTEFCNTLANLGFNSSRIRVPLNKINDRQLPCVFIPEGRASILISNITGNQYTYYDPETNKMDDKSLNNEKGHVIFFDTQLKPKTQSTLELLKNYKSILYTFTVTILMINLIYLTVPLFVLEFYDLVIPGKSTEVLTHFILGGGVIIFSLFLLSTLKNQLVRYFDGRIESTIGKRVVEQLLYFPLNKSETKNNQLQIEQIKSFNQLRKLMTPTTISQCFEIVLSGLLVSAIGIIAGPLCLIPIFLFVALYSVYRLMHQNLVNLNRTVKERQDTLEKAWQQTQQEISTIKETHAENEWYNHLKDISANYTYHHFKQSMASHKIDMICDSLFSLSGLAVIGIGAMMVIEGHLSVGALIATMMIIWKILVPIRNLFRFLPNIPQIKETLSRLNHLLSMTTENEEEAPQLFALDTPFRIEIKNLGFRYHSSQKPVIFSLHAHIEPQTIFTVTGPDGAGKSTLLKVLASLYQPQIGDIIFGEQNQSHIEKGSLRQKIGYISRESQLLPGTILSNIQLANENQSLPYNVMDLLRQLNIFNLIQELPQKLYTPINEIEQTDNYPFIKQAILFLNILLRKPPLVIIDEVLLPFDTTKAEKTIETLKLFSKQATVIIATRNRHIIAASNLTLALNHDYSHHLMPSRDFLHTYSKERQVN